MVEDVIDICFLQKLKVFSFLFPRFLFFKLRTRQYKLFLFGTNQWKIPEKLSALNNSKFYNSPNIIKKFSLNNWCKFLLTTILLVFEIYTQIIFFSRHLVISENYMQVSFYLYQLYAFGLNWRCWHLGMLQQSFEIWST